jgi:hypothetical protein
MCLTCGCNDAHRRMGDNLTYEDVRDVAVENGKTVDETLQTMVSTAEHDRTEHAEEYSRRWDAAKA